MSYPEIDYQSMVNIKGIDGHRWTSIHCPLCIKLSGEINKIYIAQQRYGKLLGAYRIQIDKDTNL